MSNYKIKILKDTPFDKAIDVKDKASLWALCNADKTMETNSALNRGFIGGYNQCLEDNKEKKYTDEQLKQALDKAFMNGFSHAKNFNKQINASTYEIMQSLQPKTEWEVEIDDNGDLKIVTDVQKLNKEK
jgi:hypothetical protein